MGRRTTRLVCRFATFVLLFFLMKNSSLATETLSIIDVMNTDKELCPISNLYKNNITSVCSSVQYPNNSATQNAEWKNTLHCLVFYDTWYKVCHFKEWQRPFNSSEAFYTYLKRFFPVEENSNEFCENVKNVKFAYEKLNPLLSSIYKNDFLTCAFACFDDKNNWPKAKFNKLCSILAWSKSIDNEISKLNDKKLSTTENSKDLLSSPNSKRPEQIQNESNSNGINRIKGKHSNDDSQNKQVQANLPVDLDKPVVVKQQETLNSGLQDKQVNAGDKDQQTDQTDVKTENLHKVDGISKNPSANIINNGIIGSTKPANDDKTNTISDNTQEHDNSANQDDWAHIGEAKLPEGANDGPEQSMITGDQNQNNPMPSEQKDIVSHHHSIRSDEESHFFTYFTIVSLISIAAYVGYHNKQKILAIVLEGRRSRSNRGRRRPSTANYRKLDCTLEEAVTSQCNANVTHVIY